MKLLTSRKRVGGGRRIWLASLIVLAGSSAHSETSRDLRIELGQAAGGSMTNRILSPSVAGTWFATRNSSGDRVLDLLILWRGTPGWFVGPEANSSKSIDGINRVRVNYGAVEIEFTFDVNRRLVTLRGQEVDLRRDQVILVDFVDSGPKVVGTVAVANPKIAEPVVRIAPLLKQSPDLVAFLKCDQPAPNPVVQAASAPSCTELAGKGTTPR